MMIEKMKLTPSIITITVLLLLSPLSYSSPLHLSTTEPPLPTHPELESTPTPEPTTFFEVTRPIPIPPNSTHCSTFILQHDFAYTYGQAPVTAPFTPCSPKPPSLIVLSFSATCRGRQFDRIFGIWASGVELLRSCTAEPRPNGIAWTVRKDLTRYSSLLSSPQTFALHLANIVDSTYTGVYHVNLSLHFYFDHHHPHHPFNSPADLILPVSRPPPLSDALWFVVHNSTDVESTRVSVPRNAYRAVLEVFVSFHNDDEFWYSNPPDNYIAANNLTSSVNGNGAFREVTVRLDGNVVGAVWPFTVIYTGGVNPLLWRPITGIGSFDLPSYDIEITPFLGELLDGKPHSIGFGVTNALDSWFVDANLHLWLDGESSVTTGKLIKHTTLDAIPKLKSNFKGLDGSFATSASRQISATGWVMSSVGKITTHVRQDFGFRNLMVFENDSSIQVVNQTIRTGYAMYAENPGSILYSEQVFHDFPLYLYTETTDEINGSYSMIANVSFTFEEERIAGERFRFSLSHLKNSQKGEGVMVVKGRLVQSGVGGTQQKYSYESTDGCYFRNVKSYNYTILDDKSGKICRSKSRLGLRASIDEWMSFLDAV